MRLFKVFVILSLLLVTLQNVANAQEYELYSSTDVVEYKTTNGKWTTVWPRKNKLIKNSVVRCNSYFTVKEIGGARRLHTCLSSKDGKKLGDLLDKYKHKAQSSVTTFFRSSVYDITEPDNFNQNDSIATNTKVVSYLLVDIQHFKDNAWNDFGLPIVNIDSIDYSIRYRMLPENRYQLGTYNVLNDKSNTVADSIRWYLNNLVDQIDSTMNNIVMVYLSSHGTRTMNGKFCFITEDSERDFNGNISNDITGTEINNYVRKLVEKKAIVLLFVDACYSGLLYSQLDNDDLVKTGRVAYFMSTEKDLKAHQDPEGSPFAKALIKVLSDDEPLFFNDNDNVISPHLLDRYISNAITSIHKDQNPRSDRGAGLPGDYKLWITQPRFTSNTLNDLQWLASNGNSDAFVKLGDLYYNGNKEYSISQDYVKAFNYYKEAFEKGNKKATPKVGICYFYGNGVMQNYKEAFRFFLTGDAENNDLSRFYLGLCYKKGLGIKKNENESEKVFDRIEKFYDPEIVAAMQNEKIKNIHGIILVNDSNRFISHKYGKDMGNVVPVRISAGYRGDPRSESSIISFLKADAEWAASGKKKSEAQFSLGEIYLTGNLGEQVDYNKAVSYFTESAKAGNMSAICSLGYCYEEGLGVKKDHVKAMDLLKKAANNRESRANLIIGNFYFYGTSFIDSDYWEAVKYWLRAANEGNKVALYKLGMVYRDGWGVDKDIKKSLEMFTKSAKKGYPNSQYELGKELYLRGEYNEAYKWFRKSEKQGYSKAKDMIKQYYYPDGKVKK